MKRRRLLSLSALAAASAVLPWSAMRAARAASGDESAWRALAGPGVALLMRHAATEPGIGDPPGFRIDVCSTQRNLSAAGRAQAQRLGEALRARGIRFDEVRSSRWCRCLDTARLAFPEPALQPLDALNSFFEDRSTAAAQTAELRRYLAALGTRRVALVTHMVNISALTGEGVAMGEALVVRADAPRGVRVLARLRVD